MDNVYISDGNCQFCKKPYCIITHDADKARDAICTRCKRKSLMIYRTLTVSELPVICPYCNRDPVYVETGGGLDAIFHFEAGKAVRHLCDLEAIEREGGVA